jgi:tripartite-type tricarboxylate transporter receptor subunit TctC
MKKLLTALVFAAVALSASAKETIQIIYGFSAADNSANYSRNLAEEANKIQDKYNFIFDAKPGAGNAIAGNYVKNTPGSIFMTSGVFWVRPAFYPKESYDPNDFRTLITQCSVPFSVASSKYSSWKEVPKDQPITIATSGLGVVSHLMAIEVVRAYPNATIIPFKSTIDAFIAALGGQVDLAVGFIGDAEKYVVAEPGKPKLNILGITGTKPVGKYATLVSQGFPTAMGKMNTPYNLMVPKTFPEDKAKEIRDILLKVEGKKSVRDSYALDYCQPYQIPEKDLVKWWDEQSKYWTNLTVGVKIDQSK